MRQKHFLTSNVIYNNNSKRHISQFIVFCVRIGYPCPETFNPADHYINKLSMIPKQEHEYQDRVSEICDSYQESDHGIVHCTVHLAQSLQNAKNPHDMIILF